MNQANPAIISGLVNLFKPTGASSAHTVYRLRRVFGVRKVGHAGTLDPFAEGVLLGCVGRATKLVERLMALPKCYRTTIRLGVTNDTFDPEYPFVPVPTARPVSRGDVESAVTGMIGEIEQIPPAYSAVKINGIRSYQLSRRGIHVEPRPKRVRIDRVEVLDYEWPCLCLEIRCGRGTYIRAIARDLGQILETGGCCETLIRTAVGPFTADTAVNLDTAEDSHVQSTLLSIEEVRRLILDP
ncbi:MAG: tRNA pseudouridine(55) synthase TruB [Phycisphaerae bacterium]